MKGEAVPYGSTSITSNFLPSSRCEYITVLRFGSVSILLRIKSDKSGRERGKINPHGIPLVRPNNILAQTIVRHIPPYRIYSIDFQVVSNDISNIGDLLRVSDRAQAGCRESLKDCEGRRGE